MVIGRLASEQYTDRVTRRAQIQFARRRSGYNTSKPIGGIPHIVANRTPTPGEPTIRPPGRELGSATAWGKYMSHTGDTDTWPYRPQTRVVPSRRHF